MEGPRRRSSLVVQVRFEGNRFGDELLARGYAELLGAGKESHPAVTTVQITGGRLPQEVVFQEVEG